MDAVQSSGKKYISFVFAEIMFDCCHPASLRGALRAIVTTREAGMRWTLGWRETNAKLADVKSCGPDTPTLVSGATRKRCRLRWPESPVHRGDHDISVKTVARGMPDCRLNLWYLPPAFFCAGGPWVRSSPGIPRALSLYRWGTAIASLGRDPPRECASVLASLPTLDQVSKKPLLVINLFDVSQALCDSRG
jgi:hypothetical protein